jgi:uncharacterized protein YqeY
MKTIKELQRERITCRAENKFRSQVLSGIIDGAKKIAKEDNDREVSESDIVLTCKRTVKALQKAHKEVKDKEGSLQLAALTEYDKEIAICEEFLPKTLSEKETIKVVKNIIDSLPEDQRNIGRVMGALKKEYKDKIDMGVASKIVKGLL